jgi:hypothetical protein
VGIKFLLFLSTNDIDLRETKIRRTFLNCRKIRSLGVADNLPVCNHAAASEPLLGRYFSPSR